jgi:hypothetical protein
MGTSSSQVTRKFHFWLTLACEGITNHPSISPYLLAPKEPGLKGLNNNKINQKTTKFRPGIRHSNIHNPEKFASCSLLTIIASNEGSMANVKIKANNNSHDSGEISSKNSFEIKMLTAVPIRKKTRKEL